jgi:ribosomal protein S18 acetylase RimI-like enzyme
MTMTTKPIERGASATPIVGCRIRPVNPDDPSDAAVAACLHRRLFGEIGPIARLGERLLQRYCYGHLLRTGLMQAVLIEVDGQPAGLAAYTGDSVALHRAALRSHLPVVLRETVRALVAEPSLLRRLPAAAGLLWERRRERIPQTTGRFAEMVAFGVLDDFRTRRFIARTGLRVPDLLLDHVLDDVRTQGFLQGRGVVLVSNKPAITFFSARADRIEPYPAAVRPSVLFWFDLAPKTSLRSS